MADSALHSMTVATPTADDELYLLKTPASTPLDRRMRVQDIFYAITALTADASPDKAADYVATWDASAGTSKKVLVGKLGVINLNAMAAGTTPADSTTYYFGSFYEAMTSAGSGRFIYVPRAGTITVADVHIYVVGTLATTETSTIYFRKNDTTDTTISSAVVCSAAHYHVNANINVSMSAGDYFECKWVTPAWATNPGSVYVSAQFLLE